jgi:hypothetical protein
MKTHTDSLSCKAVTRSIGIDKSAIELFGYEIPPATWVLLVAASVIVKGRPSPSFEVLFLGVSISKENVGYVLPFRCCDTIVEIANKAAVLPIIP